MESDRLYKVKPDDLPKLELLLNKCFADDPLYTKLIPDEDVRKRLMPELFKCDMTEFYETCEIFADSSDLNGVLVVSDEAEPYNALKFYLSELQAYFRTDGYLLKEDHSLKTFFNFLLGHDYLNSSWTSQLHEKNRIHIIYLAVDPGMQHHGIAAMLIGETIKYADRHKMMLSLETHNPGNVAFYEKFGFKTFGIVNKPHFDLKQYCLIREARAVSDTVS